MTTVAGAPPFHSSGIHAELLNIQKYFHLTRQTALHEMEISSSVEAAYMENFQHHSPNTDCIRREFWHHSPWQATA
jgi:hypothetical protein